MSSPPPDRPRARPGRPSLVTAGVALALAAGTGFAVRGPWPGAGAPATAATAVPVGTAAVTRTDVASEQDVAGTLGFRGSYRVVNELPAGIVTALPAPGRVVRRGQVLCPVAGQPVLLFYGPVPAWRAFWPGLTPGPDVRELQRNLIALGFDPAHQITPDGTFDWATLARGRALAAGHRPDRDRHHRARPGGVPARPAADDHGRHAAGQPGRDRRHGPDRDLGRPVGLGLPSLPAARPSGLATGHRHDAGRHHRSPAR